MYSFEGKFKSSPEQNLAGASRKEGRNELLQRAHLERMKREESRQRQHSAVCIQSLIRRFLCRQKYLAIERQEFDEIVKRLGSNLPDESTFTVLIQKLLFFYQRSLDGSRLLWISNHTLRHYTRLLITVNQPESQIWRWRLSRLLHLNLNFLVDQSSSRESLATPLRLFEVFTSPESIEKALSKDLTTSFLIQIYGQLVQNSSYVERIRQLLDQLTPPLLGPSANPPTALAACLLSMLQRPLLLVTASPPNSFFNETLMVEMCRHIFCKEMSEPIKWFVLPALAEWTDFPFLPLLRTISTCQPPPTTTLLYSVLVLEKRLTSSNADMVGEYLNVLAVLSCNFTNLASVNNQNEDEEEETEEDTLKISKEEVQMLKECEELINDNNVVQCLLYGVTLSNEMIFPMCQICHSLLMADKLAIYKYKVLSSLALRDNFLNELWAAIVGLQQPSLFGAPVALLTVISRGKCLTAEDTRRIVPMLATFCALFALLARTLHDAEFYGDQDDATSSTSGQKLRFSIATLVEMIVRIKEVALRLVELAFPESSLSVSGQYRNVIQSEPITAANTHMWNHLFKASVSLLRQLYARDLRRQFCPEEHWVSKAIQLPVENAADLRLNRGRLRLRSGIFCNPSRMILSGSSLAKEDMEEGVPLTTREIRTLAILRDLPFVIPFMERVHVFHNLVMKDKLIYQNPDRHILRETVIHLYVRRNYIYEDAFDKLSPENESELRVAMRVLMVNAVGLNEAGIDGGGVFRDFLTELLITSFDPNRGFFKMTNDNLLYPNPHVHLLHPNFKDHYYFIGRMLGKALYENLLVELPLAEFFLSKLVGRHSDVDIHHLASLDSVMYKNLLFLKNYEGNFAELGLDFTVVNDELGETTVEELKPNGRNIPVTSINRIEYIHLVADYKLNKQIYAQCLAFRQGLANVVPLEWLQMFSVKEVQVLISGAQVPVNVEDLRHHTLYSGGYTDDHPTIGYFWEVLEDFTDLQRRQLLKFVTSCSRPPLLGFKDLNPPFCILNAGTSERLPTASTCMNLLKLPQFQDKELLKKKLLYAIQSGSGFELS
ncbi:ubiquitin-protein ligase E3C isoform X2 [Nilaparvata lugens]|uniref:ubiquitin-protein ligase E3C isoform X1 n=1 Tax=Nilaparvata lugens TaxID=108931 RepID=UPI00193CD9D9|nr:ubiquitin-protein ligase E3C isoform X1 [Nilaparvata lugens]XP_039276574.1 ubiquitin-protein ligase E3C isoform X2 [Nilaparvata lugens]